MKQQTFVKMYHNILSMNEYNGVSMDLATRCVYCYLLSWSESNKKVYPSVTRMMNDLGYKSKNSVTRCLNKLVEAKLLETERRPNKSSIYTVYNVDTPKQHNVINMTEFKANNDEPFFGDEDDDITFGF